MNKKDLLTRMDIPAYYKTLIPSLKVNGKAESMGLCPFHDDHNPSLSIDLNKGLFNCFACGASGDVFKFYQNLKNVNFQTALKEIAQMQGLTSVTSKRVVTRFEYRDINGKVLYIKERLESGWNSRKGKPDKTFAFKHYEGNTLVKGRGCDPVVYNLPNLIKSKYAFVVEGESKADLLTSWGLTTTCLDSGCKSPWRDDCHRAFEGKEKVIILPDNDPPGQSYALRVAEALYGHVKEIKIIALPGLKEGGDIVDWAEIEGNDKAKLFEIIKEAPVWTPASANVPGIVKLQDVTPETVTWLWEGYIPEGKITLLDGDPGLGKSTITLDIAARISKGSPMPDGTSGIKGGVVLLSLEDGLGDTIRPRLEAAGADLSKIVALQGIPTEDGKLRFPTIEDVEAITRACQSVEAKLVIIDPLMGYLGGHVNSYRDQDIRQAMGPLVRMAEDLGVAVLVIRHLNKSGSNQSIYRGGGSIGIIGAARVALLVAKDPQDETKRVLAGIKNNLAPLPASLSFHIEGVNGTSKIVWGGISTHTADGLLAIPVSQEDRSALEDAADFLKDMLTEGPVDSKEILKEARNAGINEKTLHRAKKVLRVRSKRSGFGKGGTWVWALIDGQDTPYMDNKKVCPSMEGLSIYGEKEVIEVEGELCD